MAKVCTSASRKGGTGKTTTAGGVAQKLARDGKRVALIDLDSQTNAALMFMKRVPREFRVQEWFEGGEPRWSEVPLDKDGKTSLSILHGIGSHQGLPPEELRMKVEALPFDWVVFDCPPSDGLLVQSAIAVADAVLAVAEPSGWAVSGALAVGLMSVPGQKMAYVLQRHSPRKNLDSYAVTTLSGAGYDVFTVRNESRVQTSTTNHRGFPKNGVASMDLFEIVKWLEEEV